jgi:hypothetical protein
MSMVSTIGPAVRGHKARERWKLSVFAHIAGAAVGGALTGLIVTIVGLALWELNRSGVVALAILFGIALPAILYDLLRWRRTLPALQRQVPERWRRYLPPHMTALLFGWQLGLGWATRAYFASYYVLLAVILLDHSVVLGLCLGAAYGASRAVFVAFFPPGPDAETRATLDRWMSHREAVATASGIASCLTVAAIAIAVL